MTLQKNSLFSVLILLFLPRSLPPQFAAAGSPSGKESAEEDGWNGARWDPGWCCFTLPKTNMSPEKGQFQ